MKQLLSVLLVATILLPALACAEAMPGTSEMMRNIGESVVNAVDNYLDGRYDTHAMKLYMKEYYAMCDEARTERLDSIISSYISHLNLYFALAALKPAQDDRILETRNLLAECLGLDAR